MVVDYEVFETLLAIAIFLAIFIVLVGLAWAMLQALTPDNLMKMAQQYFNKTLAYTVH